MEDARSPSDATTDSAQTGEAPPAAVQTVRQHALKAAHRRGPEDRARAPAHVLVSVSSRVFMPGKARHGDRGACAGPMAVIAISSGGRPPGWRRDLLRNGTWLNSGLVAASDQICRRHRRAAATRRFKRAHVIADRSTATSLFPVSRRVSISRRSIGASVNVSKALSGFSAPSGARARRSPAAGFQCGCRKLSVL